MTPIPAGSRQQPVERVTGTTISRFQARLRRDANQLHRRRVALSTHGQSGDQNKIVIEPHDENWP